MSETSQETNYTLQENITWYLSLLTVIFIMCASVSMCGLLYLSQVPDISWERGDVTLDRIFLVDIKGAAGIAYESRRISQTLSNEKLCVTTSVRYFMWRDDPIITNPNTLFSHIFILTKQGWQSTGEACL